MNTGLELKPIYTGTTRTRWTDIDEYGLIHHSLFFTLMEDVRWQWYHSIKDKLDQPYLFPIIEANIKYRKPLSYPANIIIQLFAPLPTSKTWRMFHRISKQDSPEKICAEAWITSVVLDPQTKKIIDIPEDFERYFLNV